MWLKLVNETLRNIRGFCLIKIVIFDNFRIIDWSHSVDTLKFDICQYLDDLNGGGENVTHQQPNKQTNNHRK